MCVIRDVCQISTLLSYCTLRSLPTDLLANFIMHRCWQALFFLLLLCVAAYATTYKFSVKKLNAHAPALSSQYPAGGPSSSVFTYNYNAAVVPLPNDKAALLVRCQNQTNSTNPYSVGQSVLALSYLDGKIHSHSDHFSFSPLSGGSVVIQPCDQSTDYGTEDPRVVYREKDGLYYVLFSAVQQYPDKVVSRLALSTTPNPHDKSTYTYHGPLFPEIAWSKSGALLIRDGFPGPHYLVWGDSTLIPGLTLATSTDLRNFTNTPGVWLPTRPNSFDSLLVEAGPMPLMLSDGNYLFLYNSARHGYPSPKPDWDVQYNVGWVILDGKNPSKILQRSSSPILSPDLAWEIGQKPYLGLTPNVVFCEGWIRAKEPDTFYIFYGAADSVVGVAKLHVSIQP